VILTSFVVFAGYTQLDPVKGQWDISIAATRSPDKTVFTPQVCDQDKVTAACNQPLLSADAKDKLKVTAALKSGPLKTIDDLPAKKIVVKACYTKPSIADRPWRKTNNIIDVSGNISISCCTSHVPHGLLLSRVKHQAWKLLCLCHSST